MIDLNANDPARSAISRLAREAAPRLLADAFDDAYGEARSILRKVLVEALLQEAGARTDRQNGPEPHSQLRHDQTRAEAISVGAGTYLYGFAMGSRELAPGMSGINGLPASAIKHHQVAAIVSEVDTNPLAWDSGEAGAPDLAQISARAQEHERVLQTVLDAGPVVPMRFGTVYPSRSAVLETIRAHHLAIHAALVALDGKAEWGLTVTCHRSRPEPADAQTTALPQGEAAGRAYLIRREAEKAAAQQSAAERRQVAEAFHRAIEEVTAGSVVHPARRSPGAPDRDLDILLKASYLVDNAFREHFKEAIVDALETAGKLGCKGELTGPWPPYNFSRLELVGAEA